MSPYNFTPSELYWRERMFQEMLWHQSQSYEYQREVDKIYRDTINYVIDDLHAFFNRYGEREGLSRKEVVKTVRQTDLNLLANRVREYVENEDFSPEANAMLKEYNLTGRTNRAALLKQKIDLATHQLANEEEKLISGKLSEEITHQMEVAAGIWEMSVPEVDSLRSMATAIKNKPFKGGVWSERLWDRQDALAEHLSGIIDKIILTGQNSTTMINEVRQAFNTSAYVAKRLLVTETARVQSETQKELMLYNEFEEYRFLAEPTACEHCMELNEKVFKVEDMMPGVNSSPIHPNCRCSAAPEFGEVEELMIEPPQEEEVGQESIEDLRRITKERMDDSDFRKMLTKVQYKQFMEEFDAIDDMEILQMYHDYVEEIDYSRGGRGSYYSPRFDLVNIRASSTHPTNEKRQQFGVIHHEMGHAFDTKLFERLRGQKTGYNKFGRIHEISSIEAYDLDGKIVRDFENTILNKGLRKLGKQPPRYIDGEFSDEFDKWDIDRRYNEITKENNLDSFINEYREYGSKSRENHSTMAALSDILESTGQTPEFPMRWGHGEKYWKQSNGAMRTSEFFAHATQLRAHNEEGYKILKEYFPESVATYEEMVSDALGVDK